MNDSISHALSENAGGREAAYDFETARKVYAQIVSDFPGTKQAARAAERMPVTEALIREKRFYRQIHENAKKLLTETGINIADSKRIMEILVSADAIDFKNRQAIFIPLKADYVEECLEMLPPTFPGDPGILSPGTGPAFSFPPDRAGRNRAAARPELEKIIGTVGEYADAVRIFALPVPADESLSDFECARMMEYGFGGLKMISTARMNDREAWSFRGREDWLDCVRLMSSLSPVPAATDAFIRSAETRNHLLLADFSAAEISDADSPESLLTMVHTHVLFMMVLAQTLNPGITCIHGGMPGIRSHISTHGASLIPRPTSLLNAALARLNLWITGFPSAQMMCSPVRKSDPDRAVMKAYGCHMLLRAFGMKEQSAVFSLEQFIRDCEAERLSAQNPVEKILPLNFQGRGMLCQN